VKPIFASQGAQPTPILWILAVLLIGLLTISACATLTGETEQLLFDSEALSIQSDELQVPEPETNFQAGESEEILILEEIIVGLLLVAVVVGIAARYLRVPYTVGLVIIGLILSIAGQFEVRISPTLILGFLVPPLIFEAAFHLNFGDLRRNLTPILLLAILGVVLTTILVGGIVAWGTGLALTSALVFGALVSATDPVSVVALFRTMGVPKRLQVLLEGESLFNDGTAIVVFDLVLVLAVVGLGNFELADSLGDFVRVVGGGLIVGWVFGMLFSQAISRIDDYLIETALTCVLAYGSYLFAEHILGASGVLAVVAAGLVNGNIGPRGMSPTTRIVVINFWEFAAFLANSFIFLLIGLRINLGDLSRIGSLLVWAIGAVLIARAISVYGVSRLTGNIPLKWQHVLFWGGLRGAISLALALSLPASLMHAADIQFMAFGVVLFTLLVQGFTMGPLVRRLGLVERSEKQDEYERRHARAVAGRAAFEHLERRYRQGLLSDHSWKLISPYLAEHNRYLADAAREVALLDPLVEAEELDKARREALRAQRSIFSQLRRDGVISEGNYSLLISEIDTALIDGQVGWHELLGNNRLIRKDIDRLMAVMIQREDVENAISTLTKLGFTLTWMRSSGGFLRRNNFTLLVGFTHGQENAVYRALTSSCQKRVFHLSTPVEGVPTSVGTPAEITIGGATIFSFVVERFEIF
jgi:CPA1 family monovalent cation:H+ antiporter